mgnify:FL=1
MWFALLEAGGDTPNNSWVLPVFIGVIIVAFIAYLFFSGRKNKARQQEYVEQLEAIRPGHKVKTAGGICGIVVEVCDDNTVIIETGSENSGKSYIKMDKELIAQTDAKGPTQIAREEAEARRKAEKEAKEAAKRGETPAQTEEAQSAETANQPEEAAESAQEPAAEDKKENE